MSTLLLDRLIQLGHIIADANSAARLPSAPSTRITPQKICLLGMCGVHHGPLRWLHNSTVVSPYITYFESPAARELFEFQVRLLDQPRVAI